MGDLCSGWRWKSLECHEAWKPIDICRDALFWTVLPMCLKDKLNSALFISLRLLATSWSLPVCRWRKQQCSSTQQLAKGKITPSLHSYVRHSFCYFCSAIHYKSQPDFWAHFCLPLMPSWCYVTMPNFISPKILGWEIELGASVERMISKHMYIFNFSFILCFGLCRSFVCGISLYSFHTFACDAFLSSKTIEIWDNLDCFKTWS